MGLQRHRRLEEPRQCPTGVASRRYHHTTPQTRTGLGRLEARGSDKRSFSARAERNSLVTIESRFPPHGGLGLSVPLLALSDNLHSRCAAISDETVGHAPPTVTPSLPRRRLLNNATPRKRNDRVVDWRTLAHTSAHKIEVEDSLKYVHVLDVRL